MKAQTIKAIGEFAKHIVSAVDMCLPPGEGRAGYLTQINVVYKDLVKALEREIEVPRKSISEAKSQDLVRKPPAPSVKAEVAEVRQQAEK